MKWSLLGHAESVTASQSNDDLLAQILTYVGSKLRRKWLTL